MTWIIVFGRIIFGFIVGTLVLWFCSTTVNTEKANIKTAALYNAIMNTFGGLLLAMGILFLHTDSDYVGGTLLTFTLLTPILSFWVLMRLYNMSVLATLWLAFAMWAVQTLIQKFTEYVFSI